MTQSVEKHTPEPAPRASPPPGADLDQLAFVESVCPAAVAHDAAALRVGCRACTFRGDAPGPDGTIAIDPESFHPLVGAYHGSFDTPGADQAALFFAGCGEPGSPGGTLLVTRIPGSWQWAPRRFLSALFADACVPVREGRRDLLACHRTEGGFDTVVATVFTFDFAQANESRPYPGERAILSLVFNGGGACLDVPDRGLNAGAVGDITFVEADTDGRPHLRVALRYGAAAASPALRAKVAALCDESGTTDGWAKSIEPESYLRFETVTLDFVAAGDRFVPTAETEAWMKAVGPILQR